MDIFRPGIYLPPAFSQTERSYIIRHEQHHILRIFAFAALCIHWFNPLVWAVFLLSGRDMEMSCDEAVMRQMKEDIRADYSESLLRLSTGRKITVETPLAFGEGDTKSRIRNILHYKKPVVWIVIPTILLVLSASVFLITSSSKNKSTILIGSEYMVENLLYSTSGDIAVDTFPAYCISGNFGFYKSTDVQKEDFEYIGQMEHSPMVKNELEEYTAYSGGWISFRFREEVTDAYIHRLEGDYFYLPCRQNPEKPFSPTAGRT